MNPEVDEFLDRLKKWENELRELRRILLDCNLTEELKWGVPCYTFQNSNIILLGNFKEYCSISFIKGVLLQDSEGILLAPGENSQSVRMLKFKRVQDITDLEGLLKTYIFEAIEVEKAGLKVNLREKDDLVYPEELQEKWREIPDLKRAFESLTPGRQRAYNIFFSAPKQSKTVVARIEKYIPRILNGKGINDCVCGLSKRMPNCDGSHKQLKKKV